MPSRETAEDRERLRQWVETWRRAGPELAEIRRREIESADTQRAVRELFGSTVSLTGLPRRETSGLVEQQAWFGRLRRRCPRCSRPHTSFKTFSTAGNGDSV